MMRRAFAAMVLLLALSLAGCTTPQNGGQPPSEPRPSDARTACNLGTIPPTVKDGSISGFNQHRELRGFFLTNATAATFDAFNAADSIPPLGQILPNGTSWTVGLFLNKSFAAEIQDPQGMIREHGSLVALPGFEPAHDMTYLEVEGPATDLLSRLNTPSVGNASLPLVLATECKRLEPATYSLQTLYREFDRVMGDQIVRHLGTPAFAFGTTAKHVQQATDGQESSSPLDVAIYDAFNVSYVHANNTIDSYHVPVVRPTIGQGKELLGDRVRLRGFLVNTSELSEEAQTLIDRLPQRARNQTDLRTAAQHLRADGARSPSPYLNRLLENVSQARANQHRVPAVFVAYRIEKLPPEHHYRLQDLVPQPVPEDDLMVHLQTEGYATGTTAETICRAADPGCDLPYDVGIYDLANVTLDDALVPDYHHVPVVYPKKERAPTYAGTPVRVEGVWVTENVAKRKLASVLQNTSRANQLMNLLTSLDLPGPVQEHVHRADGFLYAYEIQVRPPLHDVARPPLLWVVNRTKDKATLAWTQTDMEGFDRYEVHRSPRPVAQCRRTDRIQTFEDRNRTSYQIQDLPTATKFYKICAYGQDPPVRSNSVVLSTHRPAVEDVTVASNVELSLLSTSFEEGFGSMWAAADRRPGNGEDYWGASTARASDGQQSLWVAAHGTHSVEDEPNSEAGVYDYRATAEVTMTNSTTPRYLQSGVLTFDAWYDFREGASGDTFAVLVSRDDGATWRVIERRTTDSDGWTSERVEIPTRYFVGEFRIGFRFSSTRHKARLDHAEGVYLDNVELRAQTAFHEADGGAKAPCELAIDGQGNVWFTTNFGNYIGKLDPESGKVTRYPVPTNHSAPSGLRLDRDRGIAWVTEFTGDKILELDMDTGEMTEYPLPKELPNRWLAPLGLTVDAEGQVWFTEWFAGRVGRLDPTTGDVKHWDVPARHEALKTLPRDIEIGPQDRIWFSQSGDNQFGRIEPDTEELTEISIPTVGNVRPGDFKFGADGRTVYVNEYGRSAVASFELGAIEETYQTFRFFLKPPSRPATMAIEPSGRIWVTELAGSELTSIDPASGEILTRDLPTEMANPEDLALDAQGRVWFTEWSADQLGYYDPSADQFREFSLEDGGGGGDGTSGNQSEGDENQAPSITRESPSSESVAVEVGDSQEFTIACSDPDSGDDLRTHWRLTQDGTLVDSRDNDADIVGNSGNDAETFSFDEEGSHTLEVWCDDEQGGESQALSWSVSVTARPDVTLEWVRRCSPVDSCLKLRWSTDNVDNFERYEIYRKKEGGAWSQIVTIGQEDDQTYRDDGLECETRYDYYVELVADGTSVQSNVEGNTPRRPSGYCP